MYDWQSDPDAMGPVDYSTPNEAWQVRVCHDPTCPFKWGEARHGHGEKLEDPDAEL